MLANSHELVVSEYQPYRSCEYAYLPRLLKSYSCINNYLFPFYDASIPVREKIVVRSNSIRNEYVTAI